MKINIFKYGTSLSLILIASYSYAACPDARREAIQNFTPDTGSITNYSGTIRSESGETYSYNGQAYRQPNHAANVAGTFASALAASAAEQDCLYQQRELQRAARAAAYGAGPAHLRAPSNAPDMSERASVTQKVVVLPDRLPVSIYSQQSAASNEVAFIREGGVALDVLGESEGMYKVLTKQGVVGWLGKGFVEPLK